jgi:hypothetical protein
MAAWIAYINVTSAGRPMALERRNHRVPRATAVPRVTKYTSLAIRTARRAMVDLPSFRSLFAVERSRAPAQSFRHP